MPGFLSGYKYIVVPHPDGKFDIDMVIELYTSIVESVENHQEEKIEHDYRKLYTLPNDRYFVALRERVGVQSENERVRLGEFKIPGRLYPVFSSMFTLWNKPVAKDWREAIKEITEGGDMEEVTGIIV